MWERLYEQYPHLRSGWLRGWLAWRLSWADRAECRARREELDCKYSYAIPNDEALATLLSLGPLIELGAGMGYWGWLLQQKGADIVLYDIAPPNTGQNEWHPKAKPYTEVRYGDARVLRSHQNRVLFLCWPPYDLPMASEALANYRGNTLAYVGHCASGHTGDGEFHFALEQEWELVNSVVIPSWLDFTGRPISAVPTGFSWFAASRFFDDGRDKLFVFKRKVTVP